MKTTSNQPGRFREFLLDFLCHPLLSILGWIIWLVLYLGSRLGITLYHCLKRQQPPISPAGEQKIGYGTKWEIGQAIRNKDARGLADIFALYAQGAILLGMLLLLLIQFMKWLAFPLTIPLVVVSIPVFLAWCLGGITWPHRIRVGLFCILTGLLGGIVAIRWPKNLSEDHWTWVLILVAGGVVFLWQSWKNPHSPSQGEQEWHG